MNAIALFVIVLTIIPVFLAQRLTRATTPSARRPASRRLGAALSTASRPPPNQAATPAPIGHETPVPPSPQ